MNEITTQQVSDWFLCNNILVSINQAAIMLNTLNQDGYEACILDEKHIELKYSDQNGSHFKKLNADNFILKVCEEIYEFGENLKDQLDKLDVSSIDEFCNKLVLLIDTEKQGDDLRNVYQQTKNYKNMQKALAATYDLQLGRNNHVR